MKRGERRFWHTLPSFFSIATGAALFLIIGILLFAQEAFGHAYQNFSLLSNLALLPAALGLVIVGTLLLSRSSPKRPSPVWRYSLYFLALLAAQLVITRSTWFYAGWDVESCYRAAENLARGEAVQNADYFRLCPNNAPLTVLLSAILWVGERLRLSVPYALLPYTVAFMLNVTCFLTVLCVRRLTKSGAAGVFTAALSTVWIALSPYMSIPYTDTCAILFPVLALYVFLCRLPSFPKWLLISLLCCFGATLKPSALILMIAFIMVGSFRALAKREPLKAQFKRLGAVFAAVMLGAIPSALWQNAATTLVAGSATPQEQLSETHYLMMGMNGNTYGGHSPEDVAFSSSFPTLSERRQANLQKAWERLASRTPAENLHFFAVKAFKAYADGTFASNKSLLEIEIPPRTDALSSFLRSIYFTNGSLNRVYATIQQAVWLAVLLLCAVAAVFDRRAHPVVPILALALLGVTLYLLLVEVWPRYLFVYAPIFTVLAMIGLENLAKRYAAFRIRSARIQRKPPSAQRVKTKTHHPASEA